MGDYILIQLLAIAASPWQAALLEALIVSLITGQSRRLQNDRYPPLNYVRKVELTQSCVADVCKGEAAFTSNCTIAADCAY
jgi:hypothetical protein